MTKMFSPTTVGFYDLRVHPRDLIPEDAIEITEEAYEALLDGQAVGQTIVPDATGNPVLVEAATDAEAELIAWRANAAVSRFQARAALHAAGLLDAAEAAVAGAEPIVRIAWADAAEWRRNSPTIAAIAAALDLTSEQIDDLFIQAATITA